MEIDLFYGCKNCGATTLITEVLDTDLIFPNGLEFDCPRCRELVGRLCFDNRAMFEAALEHESVLTDLPGGPSGRPHIRWQLIEKPRSKRQFP